MKSLGLGLENQVYITGIIDTIDGWQTAVLGDVTLYRTVPSQTAAQYR